MCLIVVGKKDKVVKEKTILENALTVNSNGFGLMYFKNEEVITKQPALQHKITTDCGQEIIINKSKEWPNE